jgi:hypothetical protein
VFLWCPLERRGPRASMTSAGDAYPVADGIRVFTRERENVGQVNNGIAEVKMR